MNNDSSSKNAINSILAKALSLTPMANGKINMDTLVRNLYGKYSIDDKEVKKIERTKKPATDRG